MTTGQLMDMIQALPLDTRVVINNQNNDWGEISLVSISRFDDDGFESAKVIIEFRV